MNNSSVRKVELEHVVPQYKLLFGKSTTLDEVIDVTDLALKAIGNKAQELYILRTTVKDYKVPFTCDMYMIKSITKSTPFNNFSLIQDKYYVVNTINGNTIPVVNVLSSTGEYLGQVGALAVVPPDKNVVGNPVGEYVDYNLQPDRIVFNEDAIEVDIIYRAPLVDPNNLPMVDEKTVTAICYYINYLDTQRKYFSKIADQNMYQLALQLKDKYVGLARVGDVFSDNDLDKLLNHAVSLGRKMYGLSNRI